MNQVQQKKITARLLLFTGEEKQYFLGNFIGFFLLFFFLLISFPASTQYQTVNIPALKEQAKNAQADSTKLRLYSLIGWELRFTNSRESERIADEMIQLATAGNDFLHLAEAYQIKGFARVLEQKLDQTLEMYAVAIAYARKANSGFVHAHLLSLIAGMYQDKGDFDKAIRYYLEGLKIAEEARSPEMIATLANNTAEAYSDAGRPISFTLPFYEKALKEETAMKNWQYVGMIYSNIAKEYMLAKNQPQAEIYASLAIENINKSNDRAYVYATVASDIGEMYLGIGKYTEAENYLLKSYRILDSIGTKDNKLIPLSALARLYLQQNKTDKAKKAGEQLLAFATTYRDKLFLRDAYKVLSAIAKKRNQPAQALDYFEAYKNWNDSIYNEKRIKSIEDVESRLKLQKNELEVKYLSDKRNAENKELKQSNIGLQATTVVILALSLVLLIVGAILWKSNRSRGRKNEELEKQKQIIEKQSQEKDTLIREINHRVKNNLQVISSLLNLQANSLTDPNATEALRDSHMRVKAISMIHQKLYGYEENASIPLGAYIHSLFADLRMVFGAGHIQMDCITEPDGLFLDMESAVPLGLILNETITNALKYAFQNRPAGKISIRIVETPNEGYILTVQDDGNGLPEDFEEAKAGSLGFRIIRELSRQLRGKYQYTNNLGTCFTLQFPNTIQRNRQS